jgi:hypothetical protein
MALSIQSYVADEQHLFDYMDLKIYLSRKDREPLVFYGHYEDSEKLSKIIVHLENGLFKGYELASIDGFEGLDEKDQKKLMDFIDYNLNDIIKYWIDFFVYHKDVPFEKILKPIQNNNA